MKRRLVLAALVVATVVCSDAWAQTTGTVTGQVINGATQQPIPGVQVFVLNTGRGALTNAQGDFVITGVLPGTHIVRALIIGFGQSDKSVVVTSGQTIVANFELRSTAIELNAVIVNAVTGRAERKRELGTNTASISATDIAKAPITKLADVLTARAPGVQLQGVAGTVGTSQRIRIRGANSISLSNEPLIIVDGVLTTNRKDGFGVGGQDYSRLNDLNYEDIANVEILKGPAASALYGTAAANGVILVTTRRGQPGQAQWRAYSELASSKDKNPYPTNFLGFQVLNAAAPMFNARGNLNCVAVASVCTAYRYCPNISAAAGTCTQDQVLALNPFTTPGLTPYVNGHRNKYGMSVGGGGEALTYYVSGDYDYEQGVIEFNDDKKYSVRANLGARVSDRVSVSFNSSYTRNNLAFPSNDNNIFSPIINGLLATPHVFTEEEKAASKPGTRTGTGFGYFMSDIAENITYQKVDRFILSSSGTYKPASWLNVNATAGLDYFSRWDAVTIQPGRLPIAATYTPGRRTSERASNYVYTGQAAGVATFALNESLMSTSTLGGSYTRELFQTNFCFGVGIVEGTQSCAATSSLFAVDEQYNEVKTVGAYFQEQLNWRDRLIVSASIRGDDNSAFGQDYGFIYYPGMSLSWVASEEPFFPAIPGVSNLRLRAAVGRSGQRPNFRDAETLFEPVTAQSNGTEVPAVRLNRIGNLNLKPERTTEWEGGFDAGLIQDKVSLEFTYFRKESQDALVARPLAPSFGLTGDGPNTGTIFDNLGSVKNWGTEIGLNARILDRNNVALNVRLGASTLDNKIEDLGANVQPIVFNRGNQQHKQGFPTGAYFGRRYQVANPTQQRLLTQADVTILDTDSAVYLGHSLPTNTQTLSADLTLFRYFTISGLVERRAGMKQLNYSEYFRCVTGYARGISTAGGGGQCAGVADPNASIEEQARFIAARFLNTQSGYVEDADFIKLREVSLSLNAPESIARVSPMLRGASITLSGRNLKTWTDYTGLDPEINETGGGANFTQGEFNTAPPLRYYTVRLNLAF